MSSLRFIWLLPALLGAACRPTAPVPPTARALPAAYGPAAPTSDTASVGALPWRQFFQDPALVALLDTAIRQNPDLQVATQRVAVAQAELLVRRGALLPTVSAVATAGVDRYSQWSMTGVGNIDLNRSTNIERHQQVPNPTPDFFLGLRSTWEVDLWGRLGALRRGAAARLLASEQGRRLVQTDLVAQTARTYYDLLALDQELEILVRNARLQERAVEVSRIQKQGGRATELAVQQFVAQLARTRSLEAETRQRIAEAENELNRLLGRYPRPVARGVALLTQPVPAALAVGVPTALLRHRPDVRQAEQELLASRADVEAARAAFLPSLTLTPYVGTQAFAAARLATPEALALGALAGLTAPLFNRAALRANLTRTTAEQIAAYYRYQQATQAGVAEVSTHLQGLHNLNEAYQRRTEEVAALNRAVDVSNELFLAGYASYLEVITAQRNVLDAELTQVGLRRQQFERLTGLYRATGGGWQ